MRIMRKCQCLAAAMLAAGSLATAAAPDTRLSDATQNRDVAGVRALLKRHVPVNAAQPDGTTALHWAARLDLVDVATLLLDSGADANATNRYGVTPLALACTNGSLAMVSRLVAAGAAASVASAEGETPLMLAARTGNAPVVKLLLAAGASAEPHERWRGQTALMWAAAEKHAAAVTVLIEGGADVSARSEAGMTPLLFAARAGDRETVGALLDGGADINQAGKDFLPPPRPRRGTANQPAASEAPTPAGSSPLAAAITNGHYELAAWMLERGADPNLDGPRGTALHALIRSRNCERTAVPCHQQTGSLDSLGLARVLLAHDAAVNARLTQNPAKEGGYDYSYLNLTGATPFLLAVKGFDLPMMRLLIANGADPSLTTAQHTSALLIASGVGFIEGQSLSTKDQAMETVRLLVEELGADVNATNDLLETTLHGTAYRGATTVAKYLIERGARVDAKDKQGRLPVNVADGAIVGPYFRAHDETAALFREVMGPSAPPRPTTQGAR